MKDVIISRLGELVDELAKDDGQKKAWEDFLVDFAEVCEKANIKEELKVSISNLVQDISEVKMKINGTRIYFKEESSLQSYNQEIETDIYTGSFVSRKV